MSSQRIKKQEAGIKKLLLWCKKYEFKVALGVEKEQIGYSQIDFYEIDGSGIVGVDSQGRIWFENFADEKGDGMDSLVHGERHFKQILNTHRKYSK